MQAEVIAHPEDSCEECGGPNITWFAANELWNRVMRGDGIVCPICFVKRAEAMGLNWSAWELRQERSSPPRVVTPKPPKDPRRAIGGRAGGIARALKLSPPRRREIAINAANKRWAAIKPTSR